jgi:hypothetical protein
MVEDTAQWWQVSDGATVWEWRTARDASGHALGG